MFLRLFIDGACRGNPGPAAYGFVLVDVDGNRVKTGKATIGVSTNNVAEYSGLLAGLAAALELTATTVEVVSDSNLLVNQMSGSFKIKNADLRVLATQAHKLAAEIGEVSYTHTPRENNSEADGLANQALNLASLV